MPSSKPIATISYNTESFLKEKLDQWYNAHIIQAYMYIKHKGEDGDKDHIHLRIEPNKRIDPMTLQEELREYTKDNKKPLGCRPFRPSKEEDWILYAVHDSEYLRVKYPDDKFEKIPYDWKDIVVSEYYDMEVAFIRAKASLKHTSSNLVARIQAGENPVNMYLSGENVFTVNAILRGMSTNDYRRLQDDYYLVSERFKVLKKLYEDSQGCKIDFIDDSVDFTILFDEVE